MHILRHKTWLVKQAGLFGDFVQLNKLNKQNKPNKPNNGFLGRLGEAVGRQSRAFQV
jgi:hypothetical protein